MNAFPPVLRLAFVVAMIILPVHVADAQGGGKFKPGASILYLEGTTQEWKKGTFVGQTPDGSQPIIKEAPNEFYKDGFQRASSWNRIKNIGDANDNAPAAPKNADAKAGGRFKPGESILYLDGVTQEWKKGTFVRETPGGTQPIIKETPNEFYKDGFQRAFAWDKIKKAGAADDNAPAVNPAAPDMPNKPIRGVPAVKDDAPAAAGGKPMTEDEIINFLSARLGDNPFADPQKLQKTKLELGELIKQRGIDFRFAAVSDFGNRLSAFGMTSEVTGPLGKNTGAPNTQDFLFGSWSTTKTGLPVGRRRELLGDINTGTVTINRDGSYLWKTGTAQGDIAGEWRPATATDMLDSGGAGVVLKNAKNGTEWVVYKYREWDTKDDWISIVQLPERGVREGGIRVPAGR